VSSTTYEENDPGDTTWVSIPKWVAQQPPTLPIEQYDEQTAQVREGLIQVARQVRALHSYCPSAPLANQMRAWLEASGALADAIRRDTINLRQNGPSQVSRRVDAGSVESSPPQVFQLP